uniref:Uncharacterized protein n=1 Tax=Parastrongyloides trichosuri TaxID=131310 RepID=A0A0N5A528_PARTI
MFSTVFKIPELLKQDPKQKANPQKIKEPCQNDNSNKWLSGWKYVNCDGLPPSKFDLHFDEPDVTTLKMLAEEAIEKEPKLEMDEDDDSDSTSLTKSEYFDERLKSTCVGRRLNQKSSSTMDEDMRVDGSFIIDVVGGSVKLEDYILRKNLQFDPFTSDMKILFQKDVYLQWQHVTANTFRSVVHLKTRKLGISNMKCCDKIPEKIKIKEVKEKVQFATLPTTINYFNRNRPYTYHQKNIILKHIELKIKDKKEIYRID